MRVAPRTYLTFSELVSRWGCSEDIIRFAVLSGELKPSMWVGGHHLLLTWHQDGFGGWKRRQLDDRGISRSQVGDPARHLYLQDPVQTSPFDCLFELACDARDPNKSIPMYDLWYPLTPPVSMDDVKIKAVFTDQEVCLYERKVGRTSNSVEKPPEQQEKPLRTTERNTLLAIIAVLCKEAKLDYSTASKTSDLIESSAAEMGVSIGATSIRDHLKKIPEALRTRTR